MPLPDPLLCRIADDCGHDADRLRKRLLDDPALRARYIAPLIKLWTEETCNEVKGKTNANS